MIKMMYFNVKIIILCIFNVFLNEIFHEILKKIRFSIRFHENIMKKNMIFLNQIRKMCITLYPKSDWHYMHNPEIQVYFSVAI